MNNELLPIGTVVKINDFLYPLMIIGYIITDEKDILYRAYTYPHGFIKKELEIIFKNNEIKELLFKGYANKDYIEFNKKVTGGN